MVLIGLSGLKGAGKNTAASAITEWGRRRSLHVVERGFADLLKLSACRVLHPECDMEYALRWADEIKNNLDLLMSEVEVHQHEETKLLHGRVSCTGREYLQRYGTESHRDVFGEDFWVDQLLPLDEVARIRVWGGGVPQNPYPDIAVITDCRFENEARRIKLAGGVVWEVQRPGMVAGDAHASERPLPRELVDYTFYNNATIEDLKTSVASMMTGDYHMQFLTHDPM